MLWIDASFRYFVRQSRFSEILLVLIPNHCCLCVFHPMHDWYRPDVSKHFFKHVQHWGHWYNFWTLNIFNFCNGSFLYWFLGAFIFFTVCSYGTFLFFSMALKWKRVMTTWYKYEEIFLTAPYAELGHSMARKIKTTAGLIFFLALGIPKLWWIKARLMIISFLRTFQSNTFCFFHRPYIEHILGCAHPYVTSPIPICSRVLSQRRNHKFFP